jgi:hypothetical protein
MKKQIHALIILTAEEKLFLIESAKKEGLSLSGFIRQKLGMPLLEKANNFTTNNHNKKFDPEEISKFKNAKEAMLATGISQPRYYILKKMYKNDFDWPQKKSIDATTACVYNSFYRISNGLNRTTKRRIDMKAIKLTVKNFGSNKYLGLVGGRPYGLNFKFSHAGLEFLLNAELSLENGDLVCKSNDFKTYYVDELETKCRYCYDGCKKCGKGYKESWITTTKSFSIRNSTTNEIKALKSSAKKAMREALLREISELSDDVTYEVFDANDI